MVPFRAIAVIARVGVVVVVIAWSKLVITFIQSICMLTFSEGGVHDAGVLSGLHILVVRLVSPLVSGRVDQPCAVQ